MNPIVIVNFKTYPQSTGQNAVILAKICEKIALETYHDIRIAVSAPDIYPITKEVSIPVYAEHVDPYPLGRNTGSILPEVIKTAGASGTLLNHSEHRLQLQKLEETIQRCFDMSMTTIVCVETPEEAAEIAPFNPDFIAIEPPELIGGNISVSKARPELITKCVNAVKEKSIVKVLVGAGIKTKEDIVKALELGADGILLASGITLAEDQEKALRDLIP